MKKITKDDIVLQDYMTAEKFCKEYRMPFNGFTGLQKIVLSTTRFWDLNQNLIIKGEPGSGKTLIAELAFLSTPLQKNVRDRKLLYLLPYRALLNEKYNYFLRGYNRSDFHICRSSSDYFEDDRKIFCGECDIGIAIYEKLNHALRSGIEADQLFYEYDLVIMDEFSIVSTIDRGIIVNEILQKYLALPAEWNDRKKARIISLTVPECQASEYVSMGFSVISSEERPVYLHEAIIQADNGMLMPKNREVMWPVSYETIKVFSEIDNECGEENFVYYENKELLRQLIIAHRKLQHNMIVFCSSRENTRNLCQSISKIVKSSYLPHGNWRERLNSIREKMGDNAYGCIDSLMLQSAEYGVTYHNADLPSELRREIEKEYQKVEGGRIDIIVATETLAYGINCSADVVIIFDRIKPTNIDDFPNFKYGSDLYMRYLNSVEYKNYVGRAGRLGYADAHSMNEGFAYLFSKDTAGTKKVRLSYYSECGRRFHSGRQLFAIKLRRRPSTVTAMVFDQIKLNDDRYFDRESVLQAVKFLSKKEKFLHEEEMINEIINRLIKMDLILEEAACDYEINKRYIFTRWGESVHGCHIPYEVLCHFQDILKEIKENTCTSFFIIYLLCENNYDIAICSINRKKSHLIRSIQIIQDFLKDLNADGMINEKTYRKIENRVEWLKREINDKDENDHGYIRLSYEMTDSINQCYDCMVLYLWSRGVSIRNINSIYGLPARYGSIKNKSRNIMHRLDCLIQYLRSFIDFQEQADSIEQIKYSIRHGMPYFCIKAMDFKIVSQSRPEICELLEEAETEECEGILQEMKLYCVTDTSSVSEVATFRKKLKQRIEVLKND